MKIQEIENEFEEAYKNCVSDFKSFELLRKIALVIAIILELALCWCIYKLSGITYHLKPYLILLALMFGVWGFCKRVVEFTIKEMVMDSFLKSFGDLKWTSDDVLSKDEIKSSLIFPSFNPVEFYSLDNIVGTFNKNEMSISDVTLKKGFGLYSCTVFKGLAIKFSLSKNFEGRTIIVEKDFHLFSTLNAVKLEDIEWSSKFNVYSNNQVEARYILTPALMEQIKALKKLYRAKRIAFSFENNSVIIALDIGGRMFETCSLLSKIENKKQWELMFFKIYYILRLNNLFNDRCL